MFIFCLCAGMFKDLIKRYKKVSREYGLVKHQPKEAGAPSPEIITEKNVPPTVPPCPAEPNSKESVIPLRRKKRDSLAQSIQPPKKPDLLSCRYELKYRISESKAQAVKTYVQNYLPLDRYALIHPGGQYPISSLYLDSENLDLCKETLLGKANRFKLRIRTYDDAPHSPFFLEIKRRADKIVLKSRARIERTHFPSILNVSNQTLHLPQKDQEALEQFVYYNQMIQGHPVVLVRYMREPFEGDTESRVRITFDRHLSYKEMLNWQIMLNGKGWNRIPIPFVILEIKFTRYYPAWLREMVRIFNLNRSSMSKYVTSIKQSRQTALRTAFPYYLD